MAAWPEDCWAARSLWAKVGAGSGVGGGRGVDGVGVVFLSGACIEFSRPPKASYEFDRSMSSSSGLTGSAPGRGVICSWLRVSRGRGAEWGVAGVGEYRYSREGVAAFLGIVFGLAKDGKKKWAPVVGGTARGVVGGEGEADALRLLCWGIILAFWVHVSL